MMTEIKPINEDIYNYIKDQSNTKFKQAGLYKDAYIIKNYIKSGGQFDEESLNSDYLRRVLRFIAEQWVDVEQYLNEHEITPIEKLQNSKVVRPINRIDKNTPITIHELIQLHGKAKVLQLCKDKKDENKIIWKSGNIFLKNK